MMRATRNGRTYCTGDPGFDEAWGANMRDLVADWTRRYTERRAERMATDPEYRAQQEALDAEYDRLFSSPSPSPSRTPP